MNRAERRRQLKEDERVVARGLSGDEIEPLQVMALMRVLHDRLEESRNARSVEPLMAYFHDNMRAAARAGPAKRLACRLGCSHCCRALVSARAPEVLFIKRSLRPNQREAIRAAVAETYAVTGTLPAEQRDTMAVPCPLLKDNVCQVYAARPATCQTAVSEDVAACARAFQPGAPHELIPMPEYYVTTRKGYSLALAGALKRGGFPTPAYEFNAALHVVLAKPDAESSWLAGEPVFEGVQTEPGADPLTLPSRRRLYDAAWAG